jgi:hypothetical protein
MIKFLEDHGVHLGLILAGVSGAFLSISVNSKLTPWQKVVVVLSGAGTANYLTPLVLSYVKLGDGTQYGLAFLVGFSGLKFTEWMIVNITNKIEHKNTKTDI